MLRGTFVLFLFFIVSFAYPNQKVPSLDGTFLFPGYDGELLKNQEEIAQALDTLKFLGMDTAILHFSSNKSADSKCIANTGYKRLPNLLSRTQMLLEEASERGISIILGTVFSMNCSNYWATLKESDGKELSEVLKTLTPVMNHPNLKGWYLPSEPVIDNQDQPAYFKEQVRRIRQYSGKMISIAPYLAGYITEKYSPDQVGKMAKSFGEKAALGLQMWQDSVGASAVQNPSDYYRSIQKWIGKDKLWADIELFNYGEVFGTGGSYFPTSISRLVKQLENSKFVEKRVSWLQQVHLRNVNLPSGHYLEGFSKGGDRLFDFYKAYLGDQKLKRISFSYECSDIDKSKLNDGNVGDPKNIGDKNWVGIKGGFTIQIKLEKTEKVKWITLLLVNSEKDAAQFPDRAKINCFKDSNLLMSVEVTHLPAKKNSEFVLANENPLEVECDAMSLEVINPDWTFLSEIEILATN